jgi:transaldolase
MKIFLDTADVQVLRDANETGLLDGVTTNPSKLAKTGKKVMDVIEEICAFVKGPVSVEAMGDTVEEMVQEADRYSRIAPNVNVKIPMTRIGLKAVPVLERHHGIQTNVTMVFSPTQALLAMKAGASFVSIVLGRLDSCGQESDILISDTMAIKMNYQFDSNIIAGSVKTQNHLLQCLRAGVDIATIPESLFFEMFCHPLTDAGLAQFMEDWKKVPK